MAERQYETKAFDLSFLDKGFYEDGKLRPDLIDNKAKELGARFAKGGFDRVSSAQMRRFFGDVRELEQRVKKGLVDQYKDPKSTNEEYLKEYLALIRMLKSKVAYAAGRGHVSRAFALTISICVDQIKTPRDFLEGFVRFFESIVGYYYGEGGGVR